MVAYNHAFVVLIRKRSVELSDDGLAHWAKVATKSETSFRVSLPARQGMSEKSLTMKCARCSQGMSHPVRHDGQKSSGWSFFSFSVGSVYNGNLFRLFEIWDSSV